MFTNCYIYNKVRRCTWHGPKATRELPTGPGQTRGGEGLTRGPETGPAALQQAWADVGRHAVTLGASLARAPRAVPVLWSLREGARARGK